MCNCEEELPLWFTVGSKTNDYMLKVLIGAYIILMGAIIGALIFGSFVA